VRELFSLVGTVAVDMEKRGEEQRTCGSRLESETVEDTSGCGSFYGIEERAV
jgi:hypothetical protein